MAWNNCTCKSSIVFEKEQIFLKLKIFFIWRNNHILTKVVTFSEYTSKIKVMLPFTLFLFCWRQQLLNTQRFCMESRLDWSLELSLLYLHFKNLERNSNLRYAGYIYIYIYYSYCNYYNYMLQLFLHIEMQFLWLILVNVWGQFNENTNKNWAVLSIIAEKH